ncbi:MAG: type II toxin-antitoxin system VapC family toxin [Planctomycetes bacterium]|nr:type II toxin-antitoxin system VapC family toxin [Planctomycetota bacterium]MBU4398170.1 type II toxin-antitoxin system VapC family toxin [Planctomycetota bacterium]MCG2685210.1 type II toxin-antitoxin system VapC family toxin [Planctomycetales bacterium]
MKPRVYLETTIVSYLTARPSRDLVMAANQEITREWWIGCRSIFDLYVSQLVFEEASAGDSDAARRRIETLRPIVRLDITDQTTMLGKRLVAGIPLPAKARADALHIAVAATNGMNYLLTWNCTHIANAALRPRIEEICREMGCEPPVICTPQELLEKGEIDA